jgi:hypothetical protein
VAPDLDEPEVRSPSAAVIEAASPAIIQAYGGGGNWINIGTARAAQPGDIVTVTTGGSYARTMIPSSWTSSTVTYTYTSPGSADIWISENGTPNIYDEAQRRVQAEISHRWDRHFVNQHIRPSVEDRWHRARQMGTFEPEPDPEVVERQRRERAEQDRIAAARHQAERERMAAARTVATELLESWLDEAQRESYRRGDGIPVVGSAGTRFRINTHSYTSNVDVLHPDTGDRVDRVCAHPAMGGGLPMPDVHLAQMLAIITDERTFLATANWDGRRLPYGDDGRLQIEGQADSVSASLRSMRRALAVDGIAVRG